MDSGVFVLPIVEKQSKTKHVESLKTRRLDEGSNPSDSTVKRKQKCFLFLFQIILMRGEKFISSDALAESR